MRFVACTSCKTLLQIGGDVLDIEALLHSETNFPCVTPLCRGRMVTPDSLSQDWSGYHRSEMPIQSFFRAINGLGSGVGAPASLKRAKGLLLSKRIVDVVGEPSGQPERMILRQLVLEDGTRLHFDTSAKGACLYYIEERGPSCMEVVDHEFSLSPNPEGACPPREEAGRASGGEPGAHEQSNSADHPGPTGQCQSNLPVVPKTGDVPASHHESTRPAGPHHGGDGSDVRL